MHRLVGDRETENELLQEISLRALEGEGPADGDIFLAWSCGIARHVIGTEWRRRRRAQAELSVEDDGVVDELCDPTACPDNRVAARESLLRAMNDVDAEGLDLLVRRYILDEPGKDLAQEMDLSPAALRMRLMRLRSTLRVRRDGLEKS